MVCLLAQLCRAKVVIFHYTFVVVQHFSLFVVLDSYGIKHRESLQSFWRKVSTNRL